MLEPRNDGKTNCLTSVHKDNLVMQLNPSKESGGKQPYQQNRVYDINGKMTCLDTDSGRKNILQYVGCDKRNDEGFRFRKNGKTGTLAARARNDESCGQLVAEINSEIEYRIRRLTPEECKRLQTVPHWFDLKVVSDTQQYKMLGNGWTIEVIKHILYYGNFKQRD